MAIGRSKVKIWIVAAGTNASELEQTGSFDGSNYSPILGQIQSYNKSGGENDVESVPLFGGFADKEKPQGQFELTIDVVPSMDKAHIFNEMAYSLDSTNDVLVSGGTLSDRAVFIENATTARDSVAGYGFNNSRVTLLDMEHNADDNQTQSLSVKFSPATDDGVPNLVFNSTSRDTGFDDITELPNWADLDRV